MGRRVLLTPVPPFERKHEPLLSPAAFAGRMLRSAAVALGLTGGSLALGMAGFRYVVGVGWADAFLNASMLLSGMGPVTTPTTLPGKLFAGSYALFSGVMFVAVAGVIVAPLAHRLLHWFHRHDASA